jgi:hypothetical protein
MLGLNCLDDLCYDEHQKNGVSISVCKKLYEEGFFELLSETSQKL